MVREVIRASNSNGPCELGTTFETPSVEVAKNCNTSRTTRVSSRLCEKDVYDFDRDGVFIAAAYISRSLEKRWYHLGKLEVHGS
jgi:hypothetical protein